MKIDIVQDVMAENNAYAEKNRELLKEKGIYTINILGSPGAGKTTLLENLLQILAKKNNSAVIEGDLATARDAARISACDVPVIQINTNGGCHLDAKMISKVLSGFSLDDINLLIIENVGNLVCPATYDLGEDIKMVVMSLTEGGDKPAKYPSAFLAASIVVLNKIDLLPYIEVDLDTMKKEIMEINPRIRIFETDCRKKSGNGIEDLAEYILSLSTIE